MNAVAIVTLFFAIVIILFIQMATTYSIFKEHRGFRKIVGYFAGASRGAAYALSFSMFVTILTVCRNFLTMLRDTFLGYYIPFDSCIELHRISAWTTVVLSVIHIVGHSLNFYQIGTQPAGVIRCLLPEHFLPTDVTPQFYEWIFLTVPGISGVFLVISFSILSVFASNFFRQRIFNAFWTTHRLFIAIIALLFIHGSNGVLQSPFVHHFLIFPVVIYIGDWIVSLRQKGIRMHLLKAEVLPSDVLHLGFKCPSDFNYQSGQWMRVACDCKKFNKFDFHPFTITSAPHETDLSVYIRGVGPWTRKLNRLFSEAIAESKPYPELYIQGPFGSTHQDWYKFETVVLMGAGIGVTPTASVLKDMVHKVYNQHKRINCKKIYFVWLARNHNQFEWFTEILRQVEEVDHRRMVGIDIFVTQLVKDYDVRTMMLYVCDKHFQGLSQKSLFTGLRAKTHFGRISFDKYFMELKKAQHRAGVSRIGIFSCGPKSSVMAVKDAAERINKDGTGPYLVAHHEIF